MKRECKWFSEHKEGGGRGLDVGGKWTRSEKERAWGMEGETDQGDIVRLQSSALSRTETDQAELILGPRCKALWLSSGTGAGRAGFPRHVAQWCASKSLKTALEGAVGGAVICSSDVSTPRTAFELPW